MIVLVCSTIKYLDTLSNLTYMNFFMDTRVLFFSTFFLQTSIFFWHGTAESLLDGAYVQVRVTVYYLNFFLYITPAA